MTEDEFKPPACCSICGIRGKGPWRPTWGREHESWICGQCYLERFQAKQEPPTPIAFEL